ncbi:MAG: hypothetical protein ACKPJF_31185 [Dolichospermum sp.]
MLAVQPFDKTSEFQRDHQMQDQMPKERYVKIDVMCDQEINTGFNREYLMQKDKCGLYPSA